MVVEFAATTLLLPSIRGLVFFYRCSWMSSMSFRNCLTWNASRGFSSISLFLSALIMLRVLWIEMISIVILSVSILPSKVFRFLMPAIRQAISDLKELEKPPKEVPAKALLVSTGLGDIMLKTEPAWANLCMGNWKVRAGTLSVSIPSGEAGVERLEREGTRRINMAINSEGVYMIQIVRRKSGRSKLQEFQVPNSISKDLKLGGKCQKRQGGRF